MRASRAFTLVELLMTIGVIGILAAMLLTVVGRVKSRVQAVCCLNNLQQWGNATHLYALDNDGFLPTDGAFDGSSPSSALVYLTSRGRLDQPTYREMPWRTNANIDPGNSIWICPSNTRRSNGSRAFSLLPE